MPVTGSPRVSTLTLTILPPSTLTMMPFCGFTLPVPLAGVIESRAVGTLVVWLADGRCPALPAQALPIRLRHSVAAAAASTPQPGRPRAKLGAPRRLRAARPARALHMLVGWRVRAADSKGGLSLIHIS